MDRRNVRRKKKLAQKRRNRLILMLFFLTLVIGIIIVVVNNNEGSQSSTEIDFKGKTREEILSLLEVDTFYSGIFLNGKDISGKTKEEVRDLFSKENDDRFPHFSYEIEINAERHLVDFSEITIHSNLEFVISEVFLFARVDDMSNLDDSFSEEMKADIVLSRKYAEYLDLQQNPKYIALTYSYDISRMESIFERFLLGKEVPVKNASIKSFDTKNILFTYEKEEDGLLLDVTAAVTKLKSLLEEKSYSAVIVVNAQPEAPKITEAMLDDTVQYINKSVSTCEDDPDRTHNIKLVCEMINGMIIEAGAFFDFNMVVGQRTQERGFREAGAILDGKPTKELGGGICQVNSMIYITALKADLKINSRFPHTWPSDYLPHKGTDATVSWGGPEFRFTNNTEYPIAIRAYYQAPDVIVEFYGRPIEDGMNIRVESVINLENPPKDPIFEADPELPFGRKEIEIHARNEISTTSYKRYYKDGVLIREEKVADSYYVPIREKVKIGVLGPDGVIYEMDKETGIVVVPEPTPEPPPEVVPTEPPPVEAPEETPGENETE